MERRQTQICKQRSSSITLFIPSWRTTSIADLIENNPDLIENNPDSRTIHLPDQHVGPLRRNKKFWTWKLVEPIGMLLCSSSPMGRVFSTPSPLECFCSLLEYIPFASCKKSYLIQVLWWFLLKCRALWHQVIVILCCTVTVRIESVVIQYSRILWKEISKCFPTSCLLCMLVVVAGRILDFLIFLSYC